jgi:putative membrane protein
VIVRRYLKITSVVAYAWRSNFYFIAVAVGASALYWRFDMKELAVPIGTVGPLGTALAIFLAFRNRSSYDRWWEARKLWGALVNESRNWTRQILTFACQKHSDGQCKLNDISDFHRELVLRHAAYVHGLRMHLRPADKDYDLLAKLLPEGDVEELKTSSNLPALNALRQGERLRDAHAAGYIDDFRHMRLDETLNKLLNIQGGCERIKNTPMPLQYDYFPQVFLYVYAFFLPFGLVQHFGWFTVAISLPISFVFLVLQAAGRVNEDPFENRWTDTPMSTLSRTIEINLREQLGEHDLPEPWPVVDGVAY